MVSVAREMETCVELLEQERETPVHSLAREMEACVELLEQERERERAQSTSRESNSMICTF